MRKLVLALSVSVVAFAATLLLSNSGNVLAWAEEPSVSDTTAAAGNAKVDSSTPEWVETGKHAPPPPPKPKPKKSAHHP